MPWEEVRCPKAGCGHKATKVGDNYYRCLNPRCANEFIYSPATDTTHTDRHIYDGSVEMNEKSVYDCSACGGRFHVLQRSAFRCRQCKKEYICAECYENDKLCKNCQKVKQKQTKEAGDRDFVVRLVWTIIVVIILLLVLSDLGYLDGSAWGAQEAGSYYLHPTRVSGL